MGFFSTISTAEEENAAPWDIEDECEQLVRLTERLLDARAEGGEGMYYQRDNWQFLQITIRSSLEDEWGWDERAAQLASQEWLEGLWFESNDVIYVDGSRDEFLKNIERECEGNDGSVIATMADLLP